MQPAAWRSAFNVATAFYLDCTMVIRLNDLLRQSRLQLSRYEKGAAAPRPVSGLLAAASRMDAFIGVGRREHPFP
ncbi:hypothetical protein D3C73_1617970 [compost metagenome]